MLANAQGNPISNNNCQVFPTPGQLYDHTSEKELYFSCHLPGMKAYFRQLKNIFAPDKLAKIEKELEHSDTKRADIKRVLMRFNKEQMIGFRLDAI